MIYSPQARCIAGVESLELVSDKKKNVSIIINVPTSLSTKHFSNNIILKEVIIMNENNDLRDFL